MKTNDDLRPVRLVLLGLLLFWVVVVWLVRNVS